MPANNKTSITVLEGDYIFDDFVDSRLTTEFRSANNTIYDSGTPMNHLKTYPTKLTLLNVNDEQKHPFADRLIEYLLDFAISNVDQLDDNIKRVQYLLSLLYSSKIKVYGSWDESINDSIYKMALNPHLGFNTGATSKYITAKSNLIKKSENAIGGKIYDYNILDMSPDILTYVDKDIESALNATEDVEYVYVR